MKYGLKTEYIILINNIFSKYKEIKKVLIYGSRVKGNYKSYSDIDLTIISNEIDLTTLHKIEIDIDDILLPYKSDISIFNQIENKELLNHIERVGEIFYEKED